MLKREIKYQDFNDEEVVEEFYFNISKSELVELEVEYKDGFSGMIQKIIESKDSKELVKQFKQIVLLAYGQKSADGKHFLKSDEMKTEFSQSAAYNALFMELATDAGAADIFIKGIMPKDMNKPVDQDKPTGPPVPLRRET